MAALEHRIESTRNMTISWHKYVTDSILNISVLDSKLGFFAELQRPPNPGETFPPNEIMGGFAIANEVGVGIELERLEGRVCLMLIRIPRAAYCG